MDENKRKVLVFYGWAEAASTVELDADGDPIITPFLSSNGLPPAETFLDRYMVKLKQLTEQGAKLGECKQTSGKKQQLPLYQCHKKVRAAKIASVVDLGCDVTTDENPIVQVWFAGVHASINPRTFNLRGKPTPEPGWYLVQYEDGYESFSPGRSFEEGYTLISEAKELAVGDMVVFSPASGNGVTTPKRITQATTINDMVFYTLEGDPGGQFLATSLQRI